MPKSAHIKKYQFSIEQLKKKYEPFYKKIGTVFCSALKDDVHFGNIGWKHIRYDSHKHKRLPANIAMRFNLLPYIPEVLKNAKSHFKEEGTLKNGNKILFYELAEEVNVDGKTKHVTVIITEVVGGRKHYFSARYTRLKKKKTP